MVSEKKPFRVAIVGGGIGGLFAALSLHHHCRDQGIQICVYEQASKYSEVSTGVGIGIHAAKLLHRIGLGDAVNAIAGDRNGVWTSFRRYDDGREIVTVPTIDEQTIRQLPVHRAEFLEVLWQAVKKRDAATLYTQKKCTGVEENNTSVTLRFEDGTSAAADLVVACDGIHSKIRSQFAIDNPVYSGRIAYRVLLDIKDVEAWWPYKWYSIGWLGKDRHFLVFPVSQNRYLSVVAFVTIPYNETGATMESWMVTGSKAELEESFPDFDETVRRIVALAPPDPMKWLLNDREPLEKWVWAGGQIVLLGDAAHAMLPHQGAGAGQAIEDGYILGRAVHDFLASSSEPGGQTHEDWANLYQAVRLPRAQKAQNTAREAGDVFEMQAEGLRDLPYDECLPIVRDRVKDRMKWVWTADIDEAYDEQKAKMR